MIAESKQMKKLPMRLRELRELAGVTIGQAAKAAGVSFGTLWNFEHGKTVPTVRQISILEVFYVAKLNARGKRIITLLQAERENTIAVST